MIGGFGDAEVFSFHATKVFNSLEGGAITTNDDDLANKLRLMRNFGFAGYDNVIYIGMNGKMNEMSAAMGLTSLECFSEFVTVNRRNYHLYKEELAGIPGISLIAYNDEEKFNYQYIVMEVDPAAARISRDHLAAILIAENVYARRYFHPGCHRMEPYRTLYPKAGERLPVTNRLSARFLSLPNGSVIGPEEVQKLGQVIRLVTTYGDQITQRLVSMGIPEEIPLT